ncbi:zinc finger CCCH domain-containing 53-like isoform X1 [Olea europaea subsp. europaea]|uniref:Zinc finger CCCH domain-containing 53-like isoform X1 n=1 Tax=Olea europaea subsp. europaea TaxID=158383 RepID=A0A8S0PDF6_OLEEU|nr:zinc finger CCCH domain-containing 53-like isoform X1 [Olea europaea subsp. europaea]
MDAYEATKTVFQRIQSLYPENASKIMGILLLQDHGEKEMIRLAFGPESLVHSVILKATKDFGLASSNTSSTPSSPSPSPFSNSLSLSSTNSSSRLLGGVNFPSPLSIPIQSSTAVSSWANSSFSDFQTQDDLISPGSAPVAYNATTSSAMNSAALPFYATGEVDLIDELHLQDQLSFLNDGSPLLMPKSPDMFYPQQDLASSPSGNGGGEGMLFTSYGGAADNWGGDSFDGLPHRRSCSASDVCLGPDDLGGGFGWKPCLYFARGYCKNGTSCRFVHGENGADDASMVGSPSKFEMMEQCQQLLRSKSVQQQRLAAASQLMASTNFPYSPGATNRCMNLLLQQQLQAESPRAFLGDDMHKFSRSRLERGDFGMMNPGSRQIYLTFPADSTFKEEDVSNYFSIYGPVQDVRIPYQQKRMFGFVTFVYPETVKLILAKGNPHYVCDARVLVKPYKEKGKIPDKHRKQPQMERGEYTGYSSPTGLESKDSYDLQLGAGMFYNNPDMLWRRKLEEQADLQQAIELQNRRLMGLQLDIKRNSHHRTLSTGGILSSPTQSPSFFNQNVVLSGDRGSLESKEENSSISAVKNPVNVTDTEKQSSSLKDETTKDAENPNKESDLKGSLEHNLPDSPFASPKAAGDSTTAFSRETGEFDKISVSSLANNNSISSSFFPASSSVDVAPFKSCYFQVPRFASGHEAIGM